MRPISVSLRALRSVLLRGGRRGATALALLAWSLGARAAPGEAPRFSSPLPDPLVRADGTRISSAEEWQARRRAEVLELFRTQVYGRAPVVRPLRLSFDVHQEMPRAFDGRAWGKRATITYAGPGGEGRIGVRVYYPPDRAPIGCFLLIVNRTRRIIDDAETSPMEFWPAEAIVARGYATAAFHYSDVAADRAEDDFRSGAFGVFGPTPRLDDSWGALGAWAWGASRVVDYLLTEPELAGKPIAVVGHSRGGKTALWCGAQDPRIALAISNDSGAGGAALARRTRGETVADSTRIFPYWYAANYRRFAHNETSLPLDQHWLIALMAPRLVYIASASEDTWADPAAEFGAGVGATPVFELFGLGGVGPPQMPAIDAPRHEGAIGYHVRAGKHDLTRQDWTRFMDFTDRHWGLKSAGR